MEKTTLYTEDHKKQWHTFWPHLEKAFRFPSERMKYIRLSREWIAQEKAKIREKHLKGAGGKEIAQEHADLVDEVIFQSYRAAMEAYTKNQKEYPPPPTLVALGGYGRRELNPYSDVDILFVCSLKINPLMEEIIGEMLRFLWDIGLPVSHSCRSLEKDFQPAELDLISRTSLMESRYLTGRRKVFKEFMHLLLKDLFGEERETFIQQKMQEKNHRYSCYENTVNLLEPNIKETPGGLRDFHTAIWVAKARFQLDSADWIWEQGITGTWERNTVLTAYDFLLRVRNEMHYVYGKKNDILSYQLQEGILEGLGYEGNESFSGTERLMKDYYLRANAIRAFSDRMIEHCQGERKKTRVIKCIEKKDFLWLFKAFLLSQETGQPLSEEVKDTIRSQLSMVDESFVKSTEASKLFLTILKGERAGWILRQMHEVGVLGKYLHEFWEVTGLIQHDPSHSYTVDEHSLRGIEYLEELSSTTQPELKELAALHRDMSHLEIVKLALLLHDIGKGHGPSKVDHVKQGASLVDRLLRQMNFPQKVREEVVLLVGHHILMSHTAQRRDIHDKEVVRQFAEAVENEDTLQKLYLLTYADIRAVGPHIWTVWNGALLWELYHKCRDYLSRDNQKDITGEARINWLKEEVIEELIDEIDSTIIKDYFEAMPYKYILSTTAKKIADHIRLIGKLKENRKPALSVTHNFEVGYSELMVCTDDRPGVFSQIAGTLTSRGINILGAQIFTRKDRIAIDTLQVSDSERMPLVESQLWEKIEKELLEVIHEDTELEKLLGKGKRYWLPKSSTTLVVPTNVVINNHISDTHTVLEVFIQDRMGLLYDITCVLYRLGIDIYIAKITTEANKAIDVFYITDLTGRKILDKEKLKQIKEDLLSVLQPC